MKVRTHQREILDDETLPAEELSRAWGGITRIHKVSFTAQALLKLILPRVKGLRKLTLTDLGCGNAFVSCSIARELVRRGIEVELTVIDSSLPTLNLIQPDPSFKLNKIKSDGISYVPVCDIVLSSYFCHHFHSTELVSFLRKSKHASELGTIHIDLARSKPGYALAYTGVNLLSTSLILKYDSLVSVKRSLSFDEARWLATELKLDFMKAPLQRWIVHSMS